VFEVDAAWPKPLPNNWAVGLFDGVGDDLHGLELVRTVAAPTVTHLKFAR